MNKKMKYLSAPALAGVLATGMAAQLNEQTEIR